MSITTATVFGGTGFVGRAIARTLRARGLAVRVAARHAPSAPDTAECFYRTDVRDPDDVQRAVEGADLVVNAVSLYTEHSGLTFNRIHVDAAARIAASARAAGAQGLVQLSGIGANAESDAPYVAARARGETAVHAEWPDAVILRPSVVFGPGDAFVSTLARVTRLPLVPLFGDGRVRLQPVHVDDVAAAVAALAEQPAPASVLELGGAEVLSYRGAVEAVARELGRRCALVPVPFTVWYGLAAGTSVLPNPPITRDQLALLESDNIATGSGFEALNQAPRGFRDALANALRG
jgi:NADH dehydrogenase